ncbi:MAG: hypothetical protein WCL50_14900 [Spirochaetota bacterium]
MSAAQIERALDIVDTLVEAFNARDWAFRLNTDKENRVMMVSLFKHEIEFWIEELLDRSTHVLTPVEQKDKIKNPWKYSRPTFDYSPSGKLAIKLRPLDSCFYGGLRSTWADGRTQKVESLMNSFCKGLLLSAIERRNDQIRKENREREWKEREERQKAEERIRLIEEARRANLAADLEDYARMVQIRDYVEYVRNRALRDGKPIEGDLAAWIEWAEHRAEKKDPLRSEYPKYAVEPAKPKSSSPWG